VKAVFIIIILFAAFISGEAQNNNGKLFKPDPSVFNKINFRIGFLNQNTAIVFNILHTASDEKSLVLINKENSKSLSKSLKNFKVDKDSYYRMYNNKYYSNTEAEKIDDKMNYQAMPFNSTNYKSYTPNFGDIKPNIDNIKFGR
jgi:hypothetical protein